MKRLRRSGNALRYLVTMERHQDGTPHFHGLIHEVDGPLRWRAIEAAWQREGFFVAKLVKDPGMAAFYAAKYLTKESLGRVRASVRYGKPLDGQQPRAARMDGTPRPVCTSLERSVARSATPTHAPDLPSVCQWRDSAAAPAADAR